MVPCWLMISFLHLDRINVTEEEDITCAGSSAVWIIDFTVLLQRFAGLFSSFPGQEDCAALLSLLTGCFIVYIYHYNPKMRESLFHRTEVTSLDCGIWDLKWVLLLLVVQCIAVSLSLSVTNIIF